MRRFLGFMSINISNQELPVDNMPHGNSEKQLYADKAFFDKIKNNPSEFFTHAEGWLGLLAENGDNLKTRIGGLVDVETKRLAIWEAMDAMIEKDEFGFFNKERSAIVLLELEAYVKQQDEIEELHKVEQEARTKRIELQKRVLLKLKKIAQ